MEELVAEKEVGKIGLSGHPDDPVRSSAVTGRRENGPMRWAVGLCDQLPAAPRNKLVLAKWAAQWPVFILDLIRQFNKFYASEPG